MPNERPTDRQNLEIQQLQNSISVNPRADGAMILLVPNTISRALIQSLERAGLSTELQRSVIQGIPPDTDEIVTNGSEVIVREVISNFAVSQVLGI